MEGERYGEITTTNARLLRFREENHRIRASASFRFSNHLVKSFEKPWMILLLPITTPLLLFRIIGDTIKNRKIISNPEEEVIVRNCCILFSDDSPGKANYQRSLAIGKALKEKSSDTQVIHITLSSCSEYLNSSNQQVFNLPARSKFETMSPTKWNRLIQSLLEDLLDVFRPSNFIFDGDYPYRCIINSIEERENMNRYWLRTSTKALSLDMVPTDSLSAFDATIHPLMMAENDVEGLSGESGQIITDPIFLRAQGDAEILRKDVLRQYRLPEESILIYYSVDHTAIQDNTVIQELLGQENVVVITDDSHLLHEIKSNYAIITMLDRSHSEIQSISDGAVIGIDYHSIHAAIANNLPTICIANSKSEVEVLERWFPTLNKGFIVLKKSEHDTLGGAAVERLLDNTVRSEMSKLLSQVTFEKGCAQLVDSVLLSS